MTAQNHWIKHQPASNTHGLVQLQWEDMVIWVAVWMLTAGLDYPGVITEVSFTIKLPAKGSVFALPCGWVGHRLAWWKWAVQLQCPVPAECAWRAIICSGNRWCCLLPSWSKEIGKDGSYVSGSPFFRADYSKLYQSMGMYFRMWNRKTVQP